MNENEQSRPVSFGGNEAHKEGSNYNERGVNQGAQGNRGMTFGNNQGNPEDFYNDMRAEMGGGSGSGEPNIQRGFTKVRQILEQFEMDHESI